MSQIAFGQDAPDQIAGLSLWLNGDNVHENEGAIDVWYDLSGNGLNAIQNELSERPTIEVSDVLNNMSTIKFDGINDFFLIDSNVSIQEVYIVLSYDMEMFDQNDAIVSRQTGGSSGGWFRGIAGTSNLQPNGIFGSNIYNNGIETLSFAPLNQFHIYTGSRSSIFESTLTIGRDRFYQTTSWQGAIAEIIVYNRQLTLEEDAQIMSYLYEKYGRTVNLGSDLELADTFCAANLDAGEYFYSYLWSTGDTIHAIEVNETGNYWVEVTDVFGRISTDTISVTYPGNYISGFLLCAQSDSLWQSDLAAFDVEWQDGTTTTDYSISGPGEYYLTVSDSEGCSFLSDTVVVVTDSFPLDVAISDPPVFCLGNELFLSGGSSEAQIYLWNTDEDTPFITPEGDGTYWVEATNANGCVGIDTVDVVMDGVAPTVAFIIGVACATRDVSFADATEPEGGLIVASDWTFGPNPEDEVEGATVEYSFESAGSYPVELTVLLDNGCTGTKWDTVTVSPLPLVNFDYDAVIPCAGNEVAYESMSGVPGGGTIAQWYWRFSNDTESTGVVGSTVFEDLGPASVLHIVESTVGCTDSLTVPVVVLGSPIVDFAFDTVCVGTATAFQELVDVSESGSVFYQWQFGDGFFSNFPNTSHTYDSPGSYDVTLKATGNDFGNPGCVDQLTKTVRVFDAPTALVDLQDACVGEGATLVDVTPAVEVDGAIDPVVSRTWAVALGPGITEEIGEDSLQLFFPEEAGTYPILFDLLTGAGCVGSTNGLVELFAIPMAAFTLDVPTSAPPVVATVENLSTDATGYTWYVNGEAVSNEVSPELLLPDTGEYTIGLVAENALGCSDVAEALVAVIVPAYDLAILDIQFVQQGTRIQLTALLSNYGNTVITSFDMEVEIGKDINFSQEVYGVSIAPGEVVYYPLGPDFEYLPPRTLPYSCITVSNPNGVAEETDYENNEVCVGLDKERVVFIAPYPNPVSGVVHLGFVLPSSGLMEIDIVNTAGVEVRSSDYNFEEGYTVIDYSVEGLADGLYLVRCVFEGEEEVQRIVVSQVGD